jgi:hypothetical protein
MSVSSDSSSGGSYFKYSVKFRVEVEGVVEKAEKFCGLHKNTI